MKVTDVNINLIKPYNDNPRVNEDAIEVVKKSLQEFGFQQPLVLDKNYEIIVGHTRYNASKKIGLKEIPCVIADNLNEERIKAYRIMDNKSAEFASWNYGLLTKEMTDLLEADYDLDFTGFTNEELADLGLNFDLDEFAEEGLTDEDEAPALENEPVTKLGDVWILGSHRIMCGDSTSIDDVDKLMLGEKSDMVFTDPPYGVSYQSNMRSKTDKFDLLKNDDVFLDIAPIIETSSKGWVFIWTSWKVIAEWINMFKIFGYPTNQIIWFKGGGGIGDLKKTFSSDYETGLVWNRGHELTGKRIGSVWKINKDNVNTYMHPTQKPVALAEEAISKTTRPHDSVLDLFGGSGSTIIACEKIHRKCFMMELDPKYVDVIIKRWQNYTGSLAVLESSNETFDELLELHKNTKNGE